jgi:hypothetical protein
MEFRASDLESLLSEGCIGANNQVEVPQFGTIPNFTVKNRLPHSSHSPEAVHGRLHSLDKQPPYVGNRDKPAYQFSRK